VYLVQLRRQRRAAHQEVASRPDWTSSPRAPRE
jgi:hypothetical protein